MFDKLGDFEKIAPVFDGRDIPSGWVYALAVGKTKIYNGDTLLNYYIQGDICIINSISRGDKRFSKSILRDIKQLITDHDKVLIASTVESIKSCATKHGFTYNKQHKVYVRGV